VGKITMLDRMPPGRGGTKVQNPPPKQCQIPSIGQEGWLVVGTAIAKYPMILLPDKMNNTKGQPSHHAYASPITTWLMMSKECAQQQLPTPKL